MTPNARDAGIPPHPPGPGPGALRHHLLARPSWWRCLVDGLWGTVTGYIELGAIVTTYDVRLDRGGELRAWAGTVQPAADPPAAPALRCIQGGRP